LVTDSAAATYAVIWAVAVLLPGLGSFVPLGGVTVAVLAICPEVLLGTVPVRVKLAVPLLTRSTVASIPPLPFDAPHRLGALAVQVHVKPALARAAGSGSLTMAPTTLLGPLLVTTIVYVSG